MEQLFNVPADHNIRTNLSELFETRHRLSNLQSFQVSVLLYNNFSRFILFFSCLSQETAKWALWSSSQAATCYYQSNHSKR